MTDSRSVLVGVRRFDSCHSHLFDVLSCSSPFRSVPLRPVLTPLHSAHTMGLLSYVDHNIMMLLGSSFHSSHIPLLSPCFASCSSLCTENKSPGCSRTLWLRLGSLRRLLLIVKKFEPGLLNPQPGGHRCPLISYFYSCAEMNLYLCKLPS